MAAPQASPTAHPCLHSCLLKLGVQNKRCSPRWFYGLFVCLGLEVAPRRNFSVRMARIPFLRGWILGWFCGVWLLTVQAMQLAVSSASSGATCPPSSRGCWPPALISPPEGRGLLQGPCPEPGSDACSTPSLSMKLQLVETRCSSSAGGGCWGAVWMLTAPCRPSQPGSDLGPGTALANLGYHTGKA